MLKKGFTLAEILIALSVIGIIAATSAPILSNIAPDKDKIAVLKAYKNLNDATQELISDPGYYINNSNGTCIGLACTAQPISIPIAIIDNIPTNISGNAKFAHLLTRYFNGEYNDKGKFNRANGTTNIAVLTFTTNDQVVWQVMKSETDHYVSIDVDGEDFGKSCFYDANDCKNPDRFQFKVTKEGYISGYDKLTKQYLKTRYNVKNRKNDLEEAGKDTASVEPKAWVNES